MEHADPARRCRETEGVAVDLRLDGKVAVVTGASKGIGRCVAEFLAREGCDVVITARTAAPLEAAAEKIAADTGRAVLALAGDMSVTEDIQRCVDATLEQFGQIDIYLFDQLLRGRIWPGMTVVDAGCGGGRNLVFLLREGYDVVALDSSPEAVRAVRALAADLAPRLSVRGRARRHRRLRDQPREPQGVPGRAPRAAQGAVLRRRRRDRRRP